MPGGVGLDLDPRWDETCEDPSKCLAGHARHAFGHVFGLDHAASGHGVCAHEHHSATGLMVDGPSAMAVCDGGSAPDGFTANDVHALDRLYAGAGERFGAALVGCDFDGDGIEDLAVGRPGHIIPRVDGLATDAGRVDLVMGDDGRRVTLLPPRPATGARFGAVLTAGDFDGDAFCDLAVGTPAYGHGSGGVVVFRGGPADEIGPAQHIVASEMQGNRAEAGDHAGAALAAGDLNGDGRAELIVGAPGENLGQMPDVGAVMVLWGRDDGLDGRDAQLLDGDVLHDLMANDAFGGALTTGDLNGDGLQDLIVGSTGTEAEARARVAVFPGNAEGLTENPSILDLGPMSGRDMALDAGDADGVGRDLLAVGLPYTGGFRDIAGRLVLLDLDARGLTERFSYDWGGHLGHAGDLFGADVVVVPGAVFVGTPGGAAVVGLPLDALGDVTAFEHMIGTDGSDFGAAVARAGRVDGHGDIIAIGAPGSSQVHMVRLFRGFFDLLEASR